MDSTPLTTVPTSKDPVCGMSVPIDAPLRHRHDGVDFVFCNARCLQRFTQDPSAFLQAAPSPMPAAPMTQLIQTSHHWNVD